MTDPSQDPAQEQEILRTDDEVGPFDFVVIEFPGKSFKGSFNIELLDLVRRGLIRITDLVFVHKADDGSVDVVELADADPEESGALAGLECDLPGLMSDEDVANAASVLEPGTSAALLVWENVWAVPFVRAMHRAGGELVANDRIPIADVIGVADALDDALNERTESET